MDSNPLSDSVDQHGVAGHTDPPSGATISVDNSQNSKPPEPALGNPPLQPSSESTTPAPKPDNPPPTTGSAEPLPTPAADNPPLPPANNKKGLNMLALSA